MTYRYVPESDAYDQYNDWINETHEPVTLLGVEYEPARLLKEVDPVSYDTNFNDWADGEGITIDEDEAAAGCRTEGCEEDPDDGEGWNGYCGTCADQIENGTYEND